MSKFDDMAEEAIQIAHRIQATVDALVQQREELSQLVARFADAPATTTEREEAKRNAIAIYREQVVQLDAALAALGYESQRAAKSVYQKTQELLAQAVVDAQVKQ